MLDFTLNGIAPTATQSNATLSAWLPPANASNTKDSAAVRKPAKLICNAYTYGVGKKMPDDVSLAI